MKNIIVKLILVTVIITIFIPQCIFANSTKELNDIKGHWAERDILELIAKGAINGNPDGTFKPAALVTRAEFVKMLVTAIGYNQQSGSFFKDTEKHWADIYIDTAAAEGLLTTYFNGDIFVPDAPALRFEIPEMICKALKLEESATANPYSDKDLITKYTIKLYDEYIMRGSVENGKRYFKPNSMLTKAEAAAIINRIVKYKDNPAAFIDGQKYLEKIQAGASAARDLEFEDFVNSPAAEEVVATRLIKAGEGVILFNGLPEYGGDYGQNYKVSNAKFPRINEITYNLMKEMVNHARANGHYVKARYDKDGGWIAIGYYESKHQGEAPAGSSLFTIVLEEKPAVSQFNTSKNKQPEYISWNLKLLYPHLSDKYQAGMTLEQAKKEKFRTMEMTSLMQKLFTTVYGVQDGIKLFNHAINEYDALRLSLADRDTKNNYSKKEYTYINGIEIYNSNLQGTLWMATSMKKEK